MSEFKNRIITISGEPASGKSTVIQRLREDYEGQGYTVHIFSVGHEFRRIAQERGLTIDEFNEYMTKRGNIDQLIDSTVAQRGKEINSKERQKDIYIFDSRLAFHNIPNSFSIRLTVDDNVAGKRVFGDIKRGKEDTYDTLEDAVQKTHNRKVAEVERYKQRYGIDLQDPDNYNLVIDTSYATIEDITKIIEQCLELEMKEQPYAKMWTSPKKLVPLQGERDTLGVGFGSGLTLAQLKEKIKEEGYHSDSPIEVISVDGKLYIIEGHHRNFAAGSVGHTLIPYSIIAKDDEPVPYGSGTARERAKYLYSSYLWGHESFFDIMNDKGAIEQFSYGYIYPGIFKDAIDERGGGRY